MDVAEGITRRRRQNGAAENPPARVILGKGRVAAELIQPGEGEHIPAAGVNQLRTDLDVLGLGRNQTPAGDQQSPIHGALVQALRDDGTSWVGATFQIGGGGLPSN